MDASTNWPTVVLVLMSAVVSGLVAMAVASLTNRAEERRLLLALNADTSTEWLRARMTSYSQVIQHAHGYWSSYDDDGTLRPGSDPDFHYESFKRAYSAASLLCQEPATDDLLKDLENALGWWRRAQRGLDESTPERYERLGEDIGSAVDAFQIGARSELRIMTVAAGSTGASTVSPSGG
jgi:hypothetical protein